jgi:two-component system, OmpR family, osmolarity sensor histidine kinase EnvZ
MIRLKSFLPRGLYGRAALILIVPIVTIQLVVSVVFIQRHFDRVTQQMTRGVIIELNAVLAEIAENPVQARQMAAALGIGLELPAKVAKQGERRVFYDLSGAAVIETLIGELPGTTFVDLETDRDAVLLQVALPQGPAEIWIDRKRVSASNPHQLLVVMIVTGAFMTLVAYLFLRNQLRPITRLAVAAEAFGKGRVLGYRPSGATEVRAAGRAFLEMRERIERQIEQRTLMLSGVSHDLRTPLTRLRLGLSLLPEDEETAALLGDVSDMERLVDEFLAFARGDAMETPEIADVQALVRRVVENAQRLGQAVDLGPMTGPADVRLRPVAVGRALENLVGNAMRHGRRALVGVVVSAERVVISVEDDGPGIPPERREEAMVPFARLDRARDANRGARAGLGLAIAADIARGHGGALVLGESLWGGLKAELVLAR